MTTTSRCCDAGTGAGIDVEADPAEVEVVDAGPLRVDVVDVVEVVVPALAVLGGAGAAPERCDTADAVVEGRPGRAGSWEALSVVDVVDTGTSPPCPQAMTRAMPTARPASAQGRDCNGEETHPPTACARLPESLR
jgi:hypothetical protein